MEQATWSRDYELPLAGLLGVDIDKRIDASAPWLVVHLHTIKSGGVPKLKAALHAIARLHFLSAGYLSATAKTALWTRVLTSRMMTLPLRESDPDVKRFARFFLCQSTTKTQGVPVLLNWTGVKVETLVCPLLSEFLRITRPPNVVPLVIGVSLTRCRLLPASINMLDDVLCGAKRAQQQQRTLVDLHSLGRLDLSDNGLFPDALKALALLLDRHEVADVRLENVLALANNQVTVQAIALVLRSIWTPTVRHQSPVSVSLANNSLDPQYYQVISEALEAKTRPLRRLSLARTISMFNSESREACWTWLAPIMLSTEPSDTDECELDLSGIPFYPQDSTCFRQRIGLLHTEHFELVRNALDQQLPVSCRVNAVAASYLTPNDDEGEAAHVLDPSTQYPVRAMTSNGYVLVAGGGAPPEQWVKYEAITTLDLAGSTIRRHQPRFRSLILDEMRVNVPLYHFLAAIGSELRRVSTRHLDVSDFVARMLVFSPRIEQLDVEACRLASIRELTAMLEDGRARQVTSLNLSSNGIGFQGVEQLVELYRALPELRLRHVQLQKCHIGARGLVLLEEILRTSRCLEMVDLDRSGRLDHDDGNEDSEYAGQREKLTRLYDNTVARVEPLPLRTRLAFLSVGTVVEAVQTMDAPVASLVLAFAATPVIRHLLWN